VPPRERAKRSVLSVGDGRGFVVDGIFGRFVITAAHCLPTVPLPRLTPILDEEDTYAKLFAPLGSVSAECVFVDTIADIAVLRARTGHDQELEALEYQKITEALPAIALAALPDLSGGKVPLGLWAERIRTEIRAWALSLDGCWFECAMTYDGQLLRITKGAEHVVNSISGSPIITDDGAAIGLVSTIRTTAVDAALRNAGAKWETRSPGLVESLPGWLLNEMLGVTNTRRLSQDEGAGIRLDSHKAALVGLMIGIVGFMFGLWAGSR